MKRLTESQLIRKLELFTKTYVSLFEHPYEMKGRLACKKVIDDIVEEYAKRKSKL